MATNKDKLLQSAQKNLKKKQVTKAIKDYVKIVEMDPVDVRSRQKLAELYVRTNQNTDAYEQYESVAKYFSSNGFYLKAIAIYKQMQRLDPSQIALFSRLAELNEKQGLRGNAMAEYRNLVDYYGRNGMIADEIKTLERMRDIDLDNLNVRVKLAEVYANHDRKDDGYTELESVLEILSDKGDFDKIFKLYKMFLPLYPKNIKLQMGLALAFYEKGDFGRGVSILEGLLKDKSGDPDLLRLVGRGYADLKKWPEACAAFQQLLDMDPTDLDVRESLIKCAIDSTQYDRALIELEEWKDTFLKADRLGHLTEYYETLKEALDDNSVVLQTLDSIYELTGEGDKLLDIISEQEGEPEELIIDETLSDSLLGFAEEDIEVSAERDDLTFNIVEDEGTDLRLESAFEGEFSGESEDSDAIIELDISDSLDFDPDQSNDLDFSFNLDEESAEEPPPDVAHLSEKFGNIDFDFRPDSLLPDKATETKIFKTDVDEQIAADDMESHYNLGIAYREMGLLDDAISEFAKAEKEPSRYVDCQTLKGLSFSDKGDFENAELMFQQALDCTDLEDIQQLNLGYELGLLYERAERTNEALKSYQDVFSQDKNYRDVREKISLLKDTLGVTDVNSPLALGEKRERISFL